MPVPSDHLTEALRQGLRACREGRWRDGYLILSELARVEDQAGQKLPSIFHGYLGQALARCEGRKRVGLELAQHAVESDPFRPENHYNLAAVHLMLGNRRRAVRALNEGLLLDPDNAELRALRVEIGVRRRPAIPFLSRENPLNRWLGLLGHRARVRREEQERERREDAALDRLR
jgi:hypothetical protein